MRTRLSESLFAYFEGNNWEQQQQENGDVIFYKSRYPSESTNLDFLSYSKRNEYTSTQEIGEKILKHFSNRGYCTDNCGTIINKHQNDTFFIVAGIQYFNDNFHSASRNDSQSYFILQPVLRVKYMDNPNESFLSSFVNPTTAKYLDDIEEHIVLIDDWLDFLSSCSLFVNDFTIRLKHDYGRGSGIWEKTDGVVLKFNYGGLEIGDAGVIYFSNDPANLISDIGFGLERIAWSVAKTKHFLDMIGPKPLCFWTSKLILDRVRTMTLMAMDGVSRRYIDQYNKLKMFAQQLSLTKNIDVFSLVIYYHAFWSLYLKPKFNPTESYASIKSLLNYQSNLALLRSIQLKPNRFRTMLEKDEDRFIEYLIEKNITSIGKLRQGWKINEIHSR